MLNPSTADSTINDPTITKCIKYYQEWGYHQVVVLNIFAYRSTDPKGLKEIEDPVGPCNEETFRKVLLKANQIVCAWGNHGKYRGQEYIALEWIKKNNHIPYALRFTSTGSPQHPLYLPLKLKPQRFDGSQLK